VVYVAAFLALLVVLLLAALLWQQDRHTVLLCETHDAYRLERAQLLNKIARPETPMPDGRPVPKVTQRRTPGNARDFARVGTVAPPARAHGPGYDTGTLPSPDRAA
jgi:hypothetical protein